MADTTCRHEGCMCKAREDGYCSDYCAQHAGESHGDGPHECGCGHTPCAATTG